MMKSDLLKMILITIVVPLTVTGCYSGNSPKKVASGFLNAFNEKNYEEARNLGSPETIKLVDLMESLSKMSTSIDSVPHNKIEVISEKIDGEMATVTFREVGSDEIEELKLKQIDGKWKVHITKADMSAKENSVFDTEEEGLLMEPDESETFAADSIDSNQSN